MSTRHTKTLGHTERNLPFVKAEAPGAPRSKHLGMRPISRLISAQQLLIHPDGEEEQEIRIPD